MYRQFRDMQMFGAPIVDNLCNTNQLYAYDQFVFFKFDL